MENTYTFTDREEQLLIFAICTALTSTQESYNFYARHSDMDHAEEELKDINELKALYKRFLPNLPDSELFGNLSV